MQKNPVVELVQQAREQLAAEFRAQAEQLAKLEQDVQELRSRQVQLDESLQKHFEKLSQVQMPAAGAEPAPGSGALLEQVLGGVRDLITATLPEQVLEVLTDEGEKLGVRAAVFDVRGKAAWGSSARGFVGVTDKVFRGLVVQLSQDTPFRTCYETAGHVDANTSLLKKNRNVLEKLKPGPDDEILLLPIRSAGSVSAIFYSDSGGKVRPLPVDALKILAEFAGAQLDRLMALSGGFAAPAEARAEEAEVVAEPVAEEPSRTVEVQTVEAEPVVEPEVASTAVAAEPEPAIPVEPVTPPGPVPVLGETVPVEEVTVPPAPPAVIEEPAPTPIPTAAPPPAPPVAARFDLSQLPEQDQKSHRDAQRFAKLLVSEIELYNKARVQDGRKNRDLYKRLKTDIDRSRQTYEKRFGKTVGRQFDYFHEELVRILAAGDASLLGSEYPGPTV
jgi:hypothetical protein